MLEGEKMNSKMIFFDVDGTILSHRTYQISKSTKEAIRQARASGHLTFINTGRTFAELDDTIKDVGFDGFVCGCGTYISYHDTVLLSAAIPGDMCKEIVQDLRTLGLEAVLEGSNAIYYDSNTTYTKLKKLQDVQKNGFHFNVLTWDEPEIIFDKFCIWSSDKNAIHQFREKYKDLFEFIGRGNDSLLLEVVPKGYSKATGIEFLETHLNIPHENSYALGDSENDFTMLDYVKHSIGMGNSEELIREMVSFLTKDVDQDGVAHALKHFNLTPAKA